MKQTLSLLLVLFLFAGVSVSAEQEKIPSKAEFYEVARNGVLSLEFMANGGSTIFATGIIADWDSGESTLTVAASINPILTGYNNKIYCHFAGTKARQSAKLSATTYDFEHNLCFLQFRGIKSKYGSFGSWKYEVDRRELSVGDRIYVANPFSKGDQPAKVIEGSVSGEFSPEGRNYKLHPFTINVSAKTVPSLIGAPVLNRMGRVVGILNTDISKEHKNRPEVYTGLLLIHPGSGLIEGKNTKDKFEQQSGLPMSNQPTGFWMPYRMAPLTRPWRKLLQIPVGVYGAVVTNVYDEAMGGELRIEDVVTHVMGFELANYNQIRSASWDVTQLCAQIFMQISVQDGKVPLTVYRDGSEVNVTVELARFTSSGASYRADKVGFVFTEVSMPLRLRNDLSKALTGVMPVGSTSGKFNLAMIRGMLPFSCIVKRINDTPINNIGDIRSAVEGLRTGEKVRVLILSFRDFSYSYVTFKVE